MQCGVNGVGKSTILNKVVKGLAAGGEFPSHMIKGMQAIAALLVFSGVWLVVKSKSKHDIDKHDHSLAYEKRHA